jgi:hypothetical protein
MDKVDPSNADNTATGESWRRVSNLHRISQIGICESDGRETIRVLLLSHDLKPWREKNV